MKPVALTIAGSDPSGGAGIQADLKTFHQFGVYGEAVITLLTVQNTCKVERVDVLAPSLIVSQLEAVLEDIPPNAMKTGALGNGNVIEAIAAAVSHRPAPMVVDPVMVSKHGAPLLPPEAQDSLLTHLLPLATLITPNLHEAQALAGFPVNSVDSMRQAARRLYEKTGAAILIKGGHLQGVARDILFSSGEYLEFASERIETHHTHGTGCTYSAAITAGLALGMPLREAVAHGKRFIQVAIRTNPGLGRGSGPVNHHAPVQ